MTIQFRMHCRGFSLVEMTVVLLLITLLASVAVRETSELGFQTRYEVTKDRLEMIKQAILGNPRQITNGQQAISGFVADMGRLPYTLRELLVDYDCDGPYADGNSDTVFNNDGPCPWVQETTYNSGLGVGWRGPYLNVSDNPNSSDAFTDGWGRTSVDGNYGWYFYDWNTVVQTPPSGTTSNLIIQSLGKDQQPDNTSPPADPTNYDNDYPLNISQYTDTPGIFYPQPAIRQQDWLVDISGGISVSFVKTFRALPNISFCTDTTITDKASCGAPKTWYGGCSKAGYYNTSSCTTAGGTWSSCSDSVSTTNSDCAAAGKVWYGNGYGCSVQSDINSTHATCTDNGNTWYSCSDNTKTTLQTCLDATETWYGNSLSSPYFTISNPVTPYTYIPICMKIFYRKSDSSIGMLVSDGDITNDTTSVHFDPNLIIPDGYAAPIRFTNFRGSASSAAIPPIPLNIPIGKNAIGIYQYDGTSCSNTTIFYPSDRQGPIQVDFHPNTTLPVINW